MFQIAATSKRLSDCFWSFFAFLKPFREDIAALGARQELLVVATVAKELFWKKWEHFRELLSWEFDRKLEALRSLASRDSRSKKI